MEILIAEDDDMILDQLVDLLNMLGHTVIRAQDGQGAWHMYQNPSRWS